MKTVIAIATLAASLSALTMPADAKCKCRYGYSSYVEKPALYAPRSARKETHDDVRAHSADPTGQYAGMPSWARAALGRSGRR